MCLNPTAYSLEPRYKIAEAITQTSDTEFIAHSQWQFLVQTTVSSSYKYSLFKCRLLLQNNSETLTAFCFISSCSTIVLKVIPNLMPFCLPSSKAQKEPYLCFILQYPFKRPFAWENTELGLNATA